MTRRDWRIVDCNDNPLIDDLRPRFLAAYRRDAPYVVCRARLTMSRAILAPQE